MDPCNSKEQLRKITDLQSKPCWAPLNQLTMNLGKCWEILLLNAHLGGNYCKPAAALRSMAPVKRKSSLVKPLCALLSASHPRQTTPGCLGSHLPSIDRRPQTNASYCIYYVLLLYILYQSSHVLCPCPLLIPLYGTPRNNLMAKTCSANPGGISCLSCHIPSIFPGRFVAAEATRVFPTGVFRIAAHGETSPRVSRK